MIAMPNARVNISINPDLLKRVRELAEREHRSFSAQISVLLLRALEPEHPADHPPG